jgi:hypothetical protein
MNAARKPKYWVLHMDAQDREPNAVRKYRLPPYAIQRLARDGGPTEDIAFLSADDGVGDIRGEPIPARVIAVAKSLPEGEGRYLDVAGELVEPF